MNGVANRPMDETDAPEAPTPLPDAGADAPAYQVLARKYRPETFAGLIGQEAMVRTLTNAINSNRLAHAFILTGVRGIGKTTTARIIARALNCIGPDGAGGPTPEPCGVCPNCIAIAQDRHVDVMEMDAASRTGVDDIREIIDGVRYRPTSARFKIYIIDEVHMLSKNAFNALLKTLEEPPEHVKFIFATTEIRKVPVTVLSRCQRFDLRRLDVAGLAAHFEGIAKKEGADITAPALHLIARAADGSVRDGLSLLDQAISMAERAVDDGLVRDMLGLADRSQGFDLLQATLAGDTPAALDQLARMYQDGADPTAILNDLLEIVHFLTRVKVAPATLDAPGVPEIERVRGRELSDGLGMSALARAWQMLLKGLTEVDQAPSAIHATEMVIVRLAYTSTMPTPEEAIRKLADAPAKSPASGTGTPVATPSTATAAAETPTPPPTPKEVPVPSSEAGPEPKPATASAPRAAHSDPTRTTMISGGGAVAQAVPEQIPQSAPTPASDFEPEKVLEPVQANVPSVMENTVPKLDTFKAVAQLAATRKEAILHSHLLSHMHLVAFEPGRIEFRPAPGAPDNLAGSLGQFLADTTGERWMVSVSNDEGQPTLADQEAKAVADEKAEVAEHPLVKAVMEAFPGAEITEIRHPGDAMNNGKPVGDEQPQTAQDIDEPPPWDDGDIR